MLAIRGRYENGRVTPIEEVSVTGDFNVIITFVEETTATPITPKANDWRSLVEAKQAELRELALKLFQQELVSLTRAAEIAGVDQWAFRAWLRQRGIPIVIDLPRDSEMEAKALAYLSISSP